MLNFKFEYLRSQRGLADAFDMGMRDEYAGNATKTGKRISHLIESKRGLGYCIGLVAKDFKTSYTAGRRFYAAMRDAQTTGRTFDQLLA
jgi:hypothetical protein